MPVRRIWTSTVSAVALKGFSVLGLGGKSLLLWVLGGDILGAKVVPPLVAVLWPGIPPSFLPSESSLSALSVRSAAWTSGAGMGLAACTLSAVGGLDVRGWRMLGGMWGSRPPPGKGG